MESAALAVTAATASAPTASAVQLVMAVTEPSPAARAAAVAQVEPAVLALAVLAPGVRLDRQVNCLAPLEEMEYPALQFLQTAAYHNFNSSLLRPAARMLAVGSLAE